MKNSNVSENKPVTLKNTVNYDAFGKILNAIHFAVERHAGAVRKGTSKPYVIHPIETMQILASMKADTNLMIAGVLHDTVEDTNTTTEEIIELFGSDVGALVGGHTEDKSKTWLERKTHAIEELKTASLRLKMLIMADKVANLRSMAADYKELGDELWKRFNAPKEKQAWYYSGIQDALCDLQDSHQTADVYEEMVKLYKDVFVEYQLDENNRQIYQTNTSGESYCLTKGNPQWNALTRPLPSALTPLTRPEAEKLEDQWNEAFWKVHQNDLQDSHFTLYTAPGRSLEVSISNTGLTLSGQDLGESCKAVNGDSEYEFFYSLNQDATQRFLTQLRIKHGIKLPLEMILRKDFGTDDGTSKFTSFCKNIEVKYNFFSC